MSNFNTARSVILFKNETVKAAYMADFADHLINALIVDSMAFSELSAQNYFSDFNQFDNENMILMNPKPERRRYRHAYPKHFHEMYLNFESANDEFLTFVPMLYIKEHEIEFDDENGNTVIPDYTGSNISFSYSCGYYDNEEKTVLDGRLENNDDVVTLYNGTRCLMDDACYVESRGEYYLADHCVYSEDNNENILEDDSVYLNGAYYHQNSENIFQCYRCDDHFHIDDHHEHDGNDFCESCYEEENRDKLNLYSYSTNVLHHCDFGEPELLINGKGVFCGIELECRAEDGEAEDLQYEINKNHNKPSHKMKYVATEDSSLHRDLGVEFIFAPDSIKGMSNNVAELLDSCGTHLLTSAGNGYGLHIHISNHFLKSFDKVKIQNFVTEHELFCRTIGKRDETGYQSKKAINKTADKKRACHGRYNMVNITPSQTIEFRFPKSFTDHVHIMMNIELCFSIVLFCKYGSNALNQSDFKMYSDYVQANKNRYPLLSDYIKQSDFSSLAVVV